MKINASLCLTFFVSFFLTTMYSQHDIRGRLLDHESNPVAFANLILLNAKDSVSVYYGGISEENGEFLLEDIEAKDYLLKISFVGYEEEFRKIEVSRNLDLGEVLLTESAGALDEVTIKARRPKIIREVDRITFDVENTVLSSGNSWEVLRQTPGVIINQGKLQVRNGAVTVYLNDRKVHLSPAELETLLQSFSAENLKSVEVITNPPARYDAEGGAVLNINTIKNLSPGYKGSLEGNYTQGIAPKYQVGTSHYWKGEKFNFFANYSFSPRKEIKRDESHINFREESGTVYSRWNTDFQRITRSQAHNMNFILDYDISERDGLSFSTTMSISPEMTYENILHTAIDGEEAFSDLFTASQMDTDQNNMAFDLSYEHTLDDGGSLSTNVHYTRFDRDRAQRLGTDYFDGSGNLVKRISFNTEALQEIDILTAQTDLSSSIGKAGLDSGIRISRIDSESGIEFFNAASLDELYDELSNVFDYQETVYAAYASLSRDWEKWSVQGGLRGEYTDLTGISTSTEAVNIQEYFEIFPTAYVQYQASKDHSFSFDYSRRIDRPRYESLNPFRYFLNENDFNAGNPNLRAAISNNFNFNYTLKAEYFFDLYYRDYGRSPATLAFQNNQRQFIRRMSMNLLENKTYGLDLLHGRSITGWWYAQIYASIFHEENEFLALESNTETAKNEIDGLFGQLYSSFTLSNDGTFSGNLTLLYVSDYMSGSYQFDPFSTLSIGLRKTIWNNHAELSLNFNDIFDQTNTRLTSRYLNQDNSFFAREEMRYVRLGFKYKFGNFRLADNQREINAAERKRL